jgi:CheY-like chemotaxis protein
MLSRMKQKIPSVVDEETTSGARRSSESTGPTSRAAEEPQPPEHASEERQHAQLELLRSVAEALLTSHAGVHEAFAKLASPLELDALAMYTVDTRDGGSILETAIGLSATAISSTTVDGIVADLERAGRRTLVLQSLRDNVDPRASVFRDLGFASALVGALVVDDRVLGAIVLAARSKERYSAAELTIIDTVISYLAAAYERRELDRHRYDAEHGKREFLTVLAHELRNPLAPVRNALEIIRANDRKRSPVEHSAYAMIERQLQQIGRLADDLLDANQVVLGQVELAKQRVLLDAVVQRAADQSSPWIEAARHTLEIDLPREAIALDADAKRLARAFSNLVNNAARRMDRGGRIVISAEVADGYIAVFVRAEGRAIAGELSSAVFADAAAGSEIADGQSQGGVTAGMTLVKHLVEMHGGSVTAHTAIGGVAEFEVRLPLVRVSTATLRKPAQRSETGATAEQSVSHRILIADDNADSAESMGMLLRLMGNDVRIASDGLEAVEQAAAFQPDIVLMDIGMPRLDGYEAARRIRNQPWSRDTLLVAVTGWGPSDDDEEATAAGFDRHFTKPLDPAELRRLVSSAPH